MGAQNFNSVPEFRQNKRFPDPNFVQLEEIFQEESFLKFMGINCPCPPPATTPQLLKYGRSLKAAQETESVRQT